MERSSLSTPPKTMSFSVRFVHIEREFLAFVPCSDMSVRWKELKATCTVAQPTGACWINMASRMQAAS
jgi:hypothetical protein